MTLSSEEVGELSVECINLLSPLFTGRSMEVAMEVLAMVVASHIALAAHATKLQPEQVARGVFELIIYNVNESINVDKVVIEKAYRNWEKN